jgi:signal transduction histidine kinase
VLLASALRRDDPQGTEQALRQAIEDIELEIENLRGIISDLRPSLLDDIGLLPAVEALVDRRGEGGLAITASLVVPDSQPLDPELETAVYRLVQEALTNVVKHAGAQTASVRIEADGNRLTVEVKDDGRGFDPDAHSDGFGLAGIRERVYLARGSLEVKSGSRGTTLRAQLPLEPPADSSDAQQLVS